MSKGKIRGKKPSEAQRKVLKKCGISTDDYLIKEIKRVDKTDSSKRLNQSSDAIEEWTLIHRVTGDLKIITPAA